MAMTKEGEEKSIEVKGEGAFSTGYIAPTMEVINKKKYHFGGLTSATTKTYDWVEYEKTEKMKELPSGKKSKIVGLGEIEEKSQKLEGGFFLYRDGRTDKAYVITKEGKIKKI